MRRTTVGLLAGLCLALTATPARAETKVVVKGVHLCCPNCVEAVGDLLKDLDGVSADCDAKTRMVTITAPDDKAAQKALDALAAGGFHGQTDSKTLTIKDDSGAPQGKVKSLTLTGAHNCCGPCFRSILGAVRRVEGVTGATLRPRATSFEVTGDFDTRAVIKSLNDAGFHVKVKK
jgi:copper chaperone CopZ